MSAAEVGRKLVSLCKAGEFQQAVRTLYAPDIISIEAQANASLPARVEGIDAVLTKGQWWFENNEIHDMRTTGPFLGHRDDQFIVQFEMDVTPKHGERVQMTECALYTVRDDKVAQEEFLYLMDS